MDLRLTAATEAALGAGLPRPSTTPLAAPPRPPALKPQALGSLVLFVSPAILAGSPEAARPCSRVG